MSIEEILKALEQSGYEISTESRLARVGLKDAQEIAPIIEKYAWLYDLPTVQFVKEKYEVEEDPVKKEELRLVFFDLAGSYLYRKVAKIDDRLTTFFVKAEVEVDNEKISFHNIRPLIGKTDDFEKRERLRDASFPVIEKANPDYLAMIKIVDEGIKKELGFAGYIDFYEKQKGLDYKKFYGLVSNIHAQLGDFYREKMGKFVEETLSRPWKNMRDCHVSYLLLLNHLDSYFPKEKLLPTFEKTMAGLGIDVKNQKNVHIDAEERAKKNPRASCYAAKVPSEIHLIIKPVGGYYDYEAFFHEAGHAEHYANVDAALPYPFRHLSASNAFTELFSYLFESLVRNPLWLTKNLGLNKEKAERVRYDSELMYLFMLIRYLAKFSYEYQFFSAPEMDISGKLYADTLTKFTNFIYNPVAYLDDVDTGFYSADYLRAWIARTQLTDFLEKRFGENWFEKKEAGDWLKQVWKPGSRFELEQIIEENNIGKGFDAGPLISSLKRFLA